MHLEGHVAITSASLDVATTSANADTWLGWMAKAGRVTASWSAFSAEAEAPAYSRGPQVPQTRSNGVPSGLAAHSWAQTIRLPMSGCTKSSHPTMCVRSSSLRHTSSVSSAHCPFKGSRMGVEPGTPTARRWSPHPRTRIASRP